MPLAKDLNDLILRFGGAMARAAETVLKPRHRPGDPIPDLTELERCRSHASGKLFRFFESQKTVIAGALASLRAKGRTWLVCEMGCGKSPMSLAIAHCLLKHRPFRALVLCPGAYSALDGQLRDAIKARSAHNHGKGPPGLAATRVQVLDA